MRGNRSTEDMVKGVEERLAAFACCILDGAIQGIGHYTGFGTEVVEHFIATYTEGVSHDWVIRGYPRVTSTGSIWQNNKALGFSGLDIDKRLSLPDQLRNVGLPYAGRAGHQGLNPKQIETIRDLYLYILRYIEPDDESR